LIETVNFSSWIASARSTLLPDFAPIGSTFHRFKRNLRLDADIAELLPEGRREAMDE
jgi:hypothetical protein